MAMLEVKTEQAGESLWRQRMTILAVWLLLSLISAAQRYADNLQTSTQPNFRSLFLWPLVIWSYWAAAAPLIFKLGQWIPFGKRRWIYPLLAHFLLAFVFGLLHIAFMAMLGVFFGPTTSGAPPKFANEFSRGMRIFLSIELVFYWAVLGAGIAQDSYRRYRARELKQKELEAQLNRARLHALKMQIQPHFLFNALNTIAMLIRNREHDQAVKMVAGLGELLRSSINDNPAQEISLSSELDFIRRYLLIEQFRFPDRLRVEIDVPPELLTAEVPNLILQPLVENAIRHGIARSSSASLVRITARRQDGWLKLAVEDDGLGFPATWQWDTSEGIGLKNTRVRLKQLYGDQQELAIGMAEPGGAIVRLKIPFQPVGREVEDHGKDQNLNRR
jgi:two-component system LytT family sensor kinase